MLSRARLRNAARRTALSTAAAGLSVGGQTARARQAFGLSIVLLHNTPPPVIPQLHAFVNRHRDRIVNYEDAVDAVTGGTAVDGKSSIAFSFDDGFRSNSLAATVLADAGVSACFFVPTDVIGATKVEVDAFFGRTQAEGVFDWRDLERLREAGHVIGSHCRQHKSLAAMTQAQAEDQIKGSVSELRKVMGVATHFAWPFGALAYAPVADVTRWCAEIDVVPASGVRGRNLARRYAHEGYLRRDAVDARWIRTDTDVFTTLSARRLG